MVLSHRPNLPLPLFNRLSVALLTTICKIMTSEGSFPPQMPSSPMTHLWLLWPSQPPHGAVAFFWSTCLSGAWLPEDPRGGEKKAWMKWKWPSFVSLEHTQVFSSAFSTIKAISFISLFLLIFETTSNLLQKYYPSLRDPILVSLIVPMMSFRTKPTQDQGSLLSCLCSTFLQYFLSLSLTSVTLTFFKCISQPLCRMTINLGLSDIYSWLHPGCVSLSRKSHL